MQRNEKGKRKNLLALRGRRKSFVYGRRRRRKRRRHLVTVGERWRKRKRNTKEMDLMEKVARRWLGGGGITAEWN